MTRCPSQDWDAHCDAQELPENCPTCGKDNADPETGDWASEPHKPYCSAACEGAARAEPDDSYLNSGPEQETGKYKVYWDNGAHACGTFDLTFDTAEEAEAYGKEWADECNLRDFGTTDPEHDGYSYDVIDA